MIDNNYQSDSFTIRSKPLINYIREERVSDFSENFSKKLLSVANVSKLSIRGLGYGSYHNYPDKDLLRRFCNYEEEAFNAIYKRYAKSLYDYILKKLNRKNKDKTEDVVQQTFMALIEIQTKGYNKLYDSNYVRNFLYRVAKNKAINCIKNNPTLIDSIEEKESTLIITEEADIQLHIKNLLSKIDEYGETLEKSLKDVAVLLSQGYDAEEIAEILKINKRTIDVRIARLRDKLRVFVVKLSAEDEVKRLTKQEKDKNKGSNIKNGVRDLARRIFFGR